ncbi:MAG: hypothetical protein RB191_10210 [Terriglobia bacterium]|nr:hypothetical protein [Terriglobia bacterium]
MAPVNPRAKINWAIWKHRVSFNLNEFAAVLAEVEPANERVTPERAAFLRLIQEDAMTGKLRTVKDRHANEYYKPDLYPAYFDVSKADAIQWAESKSFNISHIK